jgi:galactokinase
VNLIGEHTDYNGGYVLPTVLPQQTHSAITTRPDRSVRATSTALPGELQYEIGGEHITHTWIDYVQGVTWALRQSGVPVPGFDISVRSEVPLGKGLSSSASLEVSVLRALRWTLHLTLTDEAVAMLAHKAETDFVGAPVGIMDQMVCSLGCEGQALFLDTFTRKYRQVPIPPELVLGVIDSGIAHEHATGDYRVRRRECEEAARLLGVHLLRELDASDLDRTDRLPDPLNRRARHVITENARVLAAVTAMEANDAATLGKLFFESHASMRDDFEVSVPDIDRLVDIAHHHPDVLGARLTGGGFGGAVVLLFRQSAAARAVEEIAKEYVAATQRPAEVLLPPQ